MAESIPDFGVIPIPDLRPESAEQPVRWSLPLRIAFRFSFCYLVPFGIAGLFLFAGFMQNMTRSAFWNPERIDPWYAVLPWICTHIFRVRRHLTIFPDGDFTSGYLQHLFELMLALAATAIWSILDGKRTNYRRLYSGFALFLRFSLAIVLFSYGFDKIFPLQFGAITPTRMSQTVGNLDIFNMLWVFMASSKPYTIFSGAMEVLAGLLLLTPRLEMLGALFAVPVLTNVFILNMDYAVPVKIISSHLLLVALFLVAPAVPGLTRLLVLRKPAWLPAPPELSSRRTVDRAVRAGVAILGVLLAAIACDAAHQQYARRQAAAAEAQKSPLVGLWIADTFSATTTGSQSLFTAKLQQEYRVGPGTDHWLALGIESPRRLTIELRDGVQDGVDLALDSRTGIARVSDSDDPDWKAGLTFQTSGNGLLTVTGTVNGVPISSTWHRKDLAEFPLVREKFRWIPPERN
jgi:uncharacterized membrane protein YphA (DoxX/SURF4 family)